MRNKWTWLTAALTVLAVGSAASAIVYTEGFESGYTDGTYLTEHAGWVGGSIAEGSVEVPHIQYGNGVGGSVGLEQASRAFTWAAHSFDWSDPVITSVVIGVDFESTWMNYDEATDTYSWEGGKPFDDDYIGWTVQENNTDSDTIFGVFLEGYQIRTAWPYGASNSQIVPASLYATLPSTGELAIKPLTFYRVRVEYTKLTETSLGMDVSVIELDANGDPVAVVASNSIADLSLGSKAPQPALLTGPMWVAAKNRNASAGNADNFYLEIIPEPTTVLLSLASIALLAARRRMK